NGWRDMICRLRCIMMLLPCLSLPVHSVDTQRQNETHQELPGAEFLEFLGEWETDQGEWIDPEEMDDDYLASQVQDGTDTENYE
ncbi:MAG: hypothetical protein MI673_06170, partial [Thiotrichales bacterium]|nr:hypothetical protein [Thiotrichales bacterium]